ACPADRRPAAIAAGQAPRWAPRTTPGPPAPTVTPVANASTTSTGEAAPVISRTTADSHNMTQAVRRHGRVSHGAAATVQATAAARSAGPASDAPVSPDHDAAPAARERGRAPPAQ